MRWLLLTAYLLGACDDPLVPDPVADLTIETLTVDDCGALDGLDLTLDTDGVSDASAWNTIHLGGGAGAGHVIEHAIVEFAHVGFTVAGGATISDTEVRHSGTGLRVQGSASVTTQLAVPWPPLSSVTVSVTA